MGNLVALLICVPILVAIIIAFVSNDKARGAVVYIGGIAVMALTLFTAFSWALDGGKTVSFNLPFNEIFDKVTLLGDVVLMVLIIVLSIKYKKIAISLLSIIQTAVVVYVDLFGPKVEETLTMRYDWLTFIMYLIIGIVGVLIGIYAIGYMRGYHVHHKDVADRRKFFFAVMFLFYGAMFGLVTTMDIMWLEFFWETTSVCSFLLIGYTKTDEAITNCFRALWMNLLGGMGFAVTICIGAYTLKSFNLYEIIKVAMSSSSAGLSSSILGGLDWKVSSLATLAIAMLAFAAITKAAQFPFSKWLLGAMVAPTPSSALLHSATMVKAGIYLLIRLAPALGATSVGKMVYVIGGFTFFAASLLAISQSDGKKVLAYSTISNLGLMAACAGIGTKTAVWAAIFLMIFHAVSKSMCFQAVGAIENTTGSRDIEDMQGLMIRLPKLALVLMIGMAGMYLAPFGMLISKWAALRTVIGSADTLMILFIVFGSGSTMFYWTKWMAKLLGTNEERQNDVTQSSEYISMFIHAIMAICVCIGIPVISSKIVLPYISEYFTSLSQNASDTVIPGMSDGNLLVMIIMVIAVIVVPFVCYLLTKNAKNKVVVSYMSGANEGDNKNFVDAFGEAKELHVSNWYMEELFGEKKLFTPSVIISAAILIIMLGTFIGGAI